MIRFALALLMALQTPPTQRPGDVARAPAPARTGVVKGRVVATNGRPLVRANVTLTTEANGAIGQRRATSGSDGSFEFRDVAPESYRLAAAKPGYLQMEYGQQRAFERGTVLILTAGEVVEGLEVRLLPAGAVSGRIVDEYGDPIEGAGVQILQKRFIGGRQTLMPVLGNQGTAMFPTNDTGVYRVFSVPQGEYLVLCTPSTSSLSNAFSVAGVPGYAPTYYPGTMNAAGAQWVTVGAGQELGGIDFSLQAARTARISGVALRSNGTPLPVGVTLTTNQRTGMRSTRLIATPAGDGRFDFRNIPPGDYVLQATGPEGELFSQRLIVDGTDITDLNVRTAAASAVSGQIVFEGGNAPSATLRALVSSIELNAEAATGSPVTAAADASGTFRFSGLSGARLFRVERPPAGWFLKAVRHNGVDITDTATVLGTPQQAMTGLQIVLTNQPAAIGGTVTDSRGQPARDYSIVVFPVDRARWTEASRFMTVVRPARDGTFKTVGLPPSEYLLAAVDRLQGTETGGEWQDPEFLDAIAPRATRVVLGEGQQPSVALRLIVR